MQSNLCTPQSHREALSFAEKKPILLYSVEELSRVSITLRKLCGSLRLGGEQRLRLHET
jgi:hypothetical protein